MVAGVYIEAEQGPEARKRSALIREMTFCEHARQGA